MMKKTNKRSILAIVFAAMFVFASVAGIFLPKQALAVGKRGKIRSVRVTSVKKLTAGKTSKIKVKVNPKKVAAKVTFKTSNKSIATVSRKGVVRAKRPGRVTITVKVKSKNKKIKRIKIKVIPKKKASTKKKKKSTLKNTTAKKNTTKKDNTSGGNNDNDYDNGRGDDAPSYETALDKKTSADGVLNISYSDMTGRKIAGDWCYYLPTDFTKAKTIILPEGTYTFYDEDELKGNRTYIFNGQSYFYSGVKFSSNQEVINNLDHEQKGTENSWVNAKIVGNGTSEIITRKGVKLTFIVKGYNPVSTFRYQCKKVVGEITNSSMTDIQKVNAILDYIVDHRESHYVFNIGTYHMNTDCTGYSKAIAYMCNFAGVDCCVRQAGADRSYGQTPTHQNNLACIDGVAYVIDETVIMKYSSLFDNNNCYIGYNTEYASKYPNVNKEGKLDVNIETEDAENEGYNLILKKAGRL
ncbi:Ig-like domain-containing protein [Anaerobutyricum hallii]|uniref:Ig-like domain-containing protein n=1 Tax=Anaerobutyricum hallii TaxID=39488 RepID=UPI002674B2AE|nr:Ig-like domain-containing protein [Anaerobutyricum hallii]